MSNSDGSGDGFETDERGAPVEGGQGLGLVGMRERAALLRGTVEIEPSLRERHDRLRLYPAWRHARLSWGKG